MNIEKLTPMMQQYMETKKGYPDALVFYRIGDFYEMFYDDAKIASSELDLVLTAKGSGSGERAPMCGVPYHAVNSYIKRLVDRGYKVVIAEQMEDPAEAKGIVRRDVVKVVTPGTVMDDLSDEKTSIYVASIVDYQYGYALCVVEMSTGETILSEVEHNTQKLIQALLKNNVREVVLQEDFEPKIIKQLRELGHVAISYCADSAIKEAYHTLCEKIETERDRKAYGLLLNYLEETQKRFLNHLQVVTIENEDDVLYMDFSTQQNLELVVPLRVQSKSDTLWTFLDHCQSAMGSRLLKKWIEKPLLEQKQIDARLDKVEALKSNFMKQQELKDALSNVYDIQRLVTRVAMGSANAMDCIRLQKTLKTTPVILASLEGKTFDEYRKVDACGDLNDLLQDAFVENPPLTTNEGGMFREGYNADLDEARSIQKSGKDWIAECEAKEKERTGIKNIRIGYNRVFGYYIEVSKGNLSSIKDEFGYVRKQTLVNAERFITQELKEKEDKILHAEETAIRLEQQLFKDLLERIRGYLPKLQRLAVALAEIDCLFALSEVASIHGYIRPSFNMEGIVDLVDGKHPILDAVVKEHPYVANSLAMTNDQAIQLITGPNMGGKSTYMRQVALLVVMAQMGSFVPAKKCNLPVFDKIFTRIGASDDILSGQSTFMVEMTEANHALTYATSRSLILFDEIGRGTSTYDGMALAQAMIEYIATCVHAKTLFSTHYHELTALEQSIPGLQNVHVEVHEEKGEITFLYKVKPGKADRSYGINVARLAQLPDSVIERAKTLLEELESKKRVVQQSYQLVEMKKENPVENEILEDLKAVEPDSMSAKEALDMLYDLKKKAGL